MLRGLLDAGVLLRAAYSNDPLHDRIGNELRRLVEEGWELCFAAQAYRESWNVLTRPVPQGGYGLSSILAGEVLRDVEPTFTFLPDNAQAFRHGQAPVQKDAIVGKSVHDANVVASALAHGATRILTLNERDFRRYAEVQTLSP